MQQIHYSGFKLALRSLFVFALAPLFLFIPLDERIASGHVRGLWATLFYEIGPLGRWTLAVVSIGYFLFLGIRSLAILFGDRTALRASPSGVLVRTHTSQRVLAWADIMAIDICITRSRSRSHHWVRVVTPDGDGQKTWRVHIRSLDASDREIVSWIEMANRMMADSRRPRIEVAQPGSTTGFGRRRSLVAG